MAEATSAAPLWMIRKTTSRKPRNAATMSEAEMAGVPPSGRGSRRRLRRTTIAAVNRLSAIVAEVECRASPVGLPKHMPEAPILILLTPSTAWADAGDVARGPHGDPILLGLSLIQRAALEARRAGYGQVFLLGAKGFTPGAAAI